MVKKNNYKIYFAGSIKGGRDDIHLYKELINELQSKKYFILTPHIGNDNLSIEGETHLTTRDIYLRDMSLLNEADFLIAEISTPSHGVGYEIGYAESKEIPIICLIQKSRQEKVSAIISGNININFIIYDKPSDAITQIENTIRTYEMRQ